MRIVHFLSLNKIYYVLEINIKLAIATMPNFVNVEAF
jgi:hypothetical protein